MTASPSEPGMVRFRMKEGLDSVLLMVESDDDLCMTVTIQNVDEVPIFNFSRQFLVKSSFL